jgi:tetratricopeptide (TPR) repeat protein
MALNREQVIQTAERYVSRGKVEAAIKEYRKLLEENPTDAGTLNRVGDLWVRLNRIGEACKIFGQTADHYTADGFFVKAIAIYKKVIKLDPTRLEVYERLAELYHKQGLINEARTQYQVLADYYLKHDNAASAIAILNKMGVLEPENPSHHVKLAEIYRQQKLLDKAVAEYRTIADLMLTKGHVEEATQVLLRGLDVNPDDLGFITDAVLGLRDAGHNGAAARLLAAAVQRNPLAEKIAHLAGMDRPPTRPGTARPAERDTRPGVAEAEAAPPPPLSPPPAPRAAAPPPAPQAVAPRPAPRPAAPPAAPVPPPPAVTEALHVDLDAEFVLDLDAEEGLAPAAPPFAAGTPAPASPAAEVEPQDFELDLDLGELEELGQTPAAGLAVPDAPEEIEWSFEPEPEIPGAAAPAEGGMRIDAEMLERTAAEVQPPPAANREEDLVAEAEVFAKYGLKDKAQDRLREVLQMNPRHLGAHAQLIQLHLEQARHDRVTPLAEQLAALATGAAGREAWQQVRQRLVKAGYRVEGRRVEPPTAEPPADRMADLLHELADGGAGAAKPEPPPEPPPPAAPPAALSAPPAPAAPREAAVPPRAIAEPAPPPPPRTRPAKTVRRGPAIEDELAKIASQVLPSRKPAKPRPAPPPAAPSAAAAPPVAPPPAAEAPPAPFALDIELPGISLPEEILPPLPELEEIPPAAAAAAAPSPPPGAGSGTRTTWLDEVAGAAAAARPAEEKLFEDEEQFFDLAAELERELNEADGMRGSAQPPEQSLEEIVEGFKKGVSENLSPEAYDTHFNLGIAYREMGLLDEAIGEFQLAAKDPGYLVDCCSMLGICFLEKGLPELAIKWYRRGLEAPATNEEQTLGLLYDLGSVLATTGEREAAYKTFVELYGVNSNYRDVVARLEELGRR